MSVEPAIPSSLVTYHEGAVLCGAADKGDARHIARGESCLGKRLAGSLDGFFDLPSDEPIERGAIDRHIEIDLVA
jgi:hypothetical protein